MEMPNQKIVILVGSSSDLPFTHRIEDFLKENHIPIKCEYRISSAHRNPDKLLQDLKKYGQSRNDIVFITVAGLSDALSGVVAGYTINPVIACPPDFKTYLWGKIFSSAVVPKGVPVTFVAEPENAALAAARILALSDSSLRKAVEKYRDSAREAVVKADEELTAKEAHELERIHIETVEHEQHAEHVESEVEE
jgi:5-(carboxyamino)imidazole ribonucleotide mutase